MSLDKLLKENAAWLDQAVKRRVFDKVDEAAVNFPEEQRRHRMAELQSRIKDLSLRKEETVASYDRAIALETTELQNLEKAAPSPAVQAVPEMKARSKKRSK
jgi:hypothetical protein